jgi:hypothetical protein
MANRYWRGNRWTYLPSVGRFQAYLKDQYNTAISSDADGSNLILATAPYLTIYGDILTSSDYGENWVERFPAGTGTKNWNCVASNSDGTFLMACYSPGRLYTSSDSGVTWTERTPAGAANKSWASITSDFDGSNLAVCVNGGRIYTSSDFGVTWIERRPAGNVDGGWCSISLDSDGSNILVVDASNKVYTSSNFGASWTLRTPSIPARVWTSTASNEDGSRLVVCSTTRLYTSLDSGVTWTERRPAGDVDKSWLSVSSSLSGSFISSCVAYDGVYFSNDYGVTWTKSIPKGDTDSQLRNFQAVEISWDGSYLYTLTRAIFVTYQFYRWSGRVARYDNVLTGSGVWSSVNSWAETASGPVGFSVPVEADTIIFDATSFSSDANRVIIDTIMYPYYNNQVNTLDFRNITYTPEISFVFCHSSIDIHNGLYLKSGMRMVTPGDQDIGLVLQGNGQLDTDGVQLVGFWLSFDEGTHEIISNVETSFIEMYDCDIVFSCDTITLSGVYPYWGNYTAYSLDMGRCDIIFNMTGDPTWFGCYFEDDSTSPVYNDIIFKGTGDGLLHYVEFYFYGTNQVASMDTFECQVPCEIVLYGNTSTLNLHDFICNGTSTLQALLYTETISMNKTGEDVSVTYTTISGSGSNMGGAVWNASEDLGNIDNGGNIGWLFGQRYWVGEGGAWEDTNHWALTSGGAGGASVPTPGYKAIFDASSITTGSQVVIILEGLWNDVPGNRCYSLDCHDAAETFTFFGGDFACDAHLIVHGDTTLNNKVIFIGNGSGEELFLSIYGCLYQNSATFGDNFWVTFFGDSSLGSDFVASKGISDINGTFRTEDFDIIASTMFSLGGLTATAVYLGTSTITTEYFNIISDAANVTIDADESTIVLTPAPGSTSSFMYIARYTFGDIIVYGASYLEAWDNYGTSPEINSITFNNIVGDTGQEYVVSITTYTYSLYINENLVVNMGDNILALTAELLHKDSGVVDISNTHLLNSTVEGGATWLALLVNDCVDDGGNTGWIFSVPSVGAVRYISINIPAATSELFDFESAIYDMKLTSSNRTVRLLEGNVSVLEVI